MYPPCIHGQRVDHGLLVVFPTYNAPPLAAKTNLTIRGNMLSSHTASQKS
jgi:hypothetical protein